MKKIIVFGLGIFLFWGCENGPLDFQPNILWITCEDISPFLGSYGDSEANTPNLDMLATEGVRFTNFFANAPVCSPARFTILHGVHASSAGTTFFWWICISLTELSAGNASVRTV